MDEIKKYRLSIEAEIKRFMDCVSHIERTKLKPVSQLSEEKAHNIDGRFYALIKKETEKND